MPSLEQLIKERPPVKVVRVRKDDHTREYVDKIHKATGWEKRSIYFQVPHNRLKEALEFCLHYSNPKLRNKKLGEFISLIKK